MLTLRGEFFVGSLDPDSATSGVTVANAMTSLGNVSKFTLEPSSELIKVQEWITGNDSIQEAWSRVSGGKIKLLAEHASPFNLALNLAGRVRYDTPESVTGALIAVQDPTTKKWSKLNGVTALSSGVAYRFVKSISSDGLSVETYDNIDPATFVLTDSSATPKTLTLTTDYTLYGATGVLRLTNAASHGVLLPGLTYPLKAAFEVGLFTDLLPRPLAANMPYALTYKNLTNVTVKDTAGNVIPDTCYSIDADYGMITLTDLATINTATYDAVNKVYRALKVFGVRGNVTSFGVLSEPRIEKQVRLNGINVRNQQKMVVTLYKVSFDAAVVDFFDKDYTKTPLEAEFMSDPSKPVDSILGQFGSIEYL